MTSPVIGPGGLPSLGPDSSIHVQPSPFVLGAITQVSGSGAYQAKLTDGLIIVTGLTGALTITLPVVPAGAQQASLQIAVIRNDSSSNSLNVVPPAGDTILQQNGLQIGRFGDQLTFTRSNIGVWVWDSALGAEDYNGTPGVALNAGGAATLLQVALPDASRTVLGFTIQLNAAITGGSLAITMNVGGVQQGGTLATLTSASNPNGIAVKTLGFIFATGAFAPGVATGLLLQLIATGAALVGPATATAAIRLL